ncbi:MAG TPA: 3-deoxy-D-manno-octulosonic acid kinase [Gammaproteobacteria bacterium]|nr:3-deoxy-D-manno-octulosonic acid kinase [Gammaproteobacteria bacterium]HET7588139.1 3-deoxy-D-manno-octulosonic acid kinase [Gammaproteobacteria bacterium]
MTATTKSKGRLILYDETLVDQPDGRLFTPDYWGEQGALLPTADGRGASWIIAHADEDWVLRHYRRGGAVRFLGDRYGWPGSTARTRPWREWHYLNEMRARALPVARPVAAQVRRSGLIWRGDLITLRIHEARPLSAWLKVRDLQSPPWRAIGQTLARFHSAGAAHPDLNAHNILIQPDESVHLIDFDRGGWQRPGGAWAQQNLQRLKRSLIKLTDESAIADAWRELLSGYGPDGA